MINGQDIELNRDNLQKAVSVPYPERDSVYVLFTAGSIDFSRSSVPQLNYSIIDMRLGNGLGAVTSRKNFVYDLGTVQMTPVRHANGRDFWLLAVEDREGAAQTDNNRFLAFLINPDGVQVNPVVSRISGVEFANSVFRLRASPDSRKVVAAGFLTDAVGSSVGSGILLDFDNATGRITKTTLVPGGGFGLDYDFSPDCRKVYAGGPLGPNGRIYQFQIDRPTGEAIAATRTEVPNSRQAFGMRLAPDGRIYVATNKERLDVITNPDAVGSAVNLQRDAYRFRDTGELPNNLASFTLGKRKDFRAENVCTGQEVRFTPQVNYRVLRWFWDFGDQASGAANESNEESPSHTFTGGGTYRVRMVTLNRCQEYDTVVKQVTVYDDPVQNLPDSTEVCFGKVPVTFTAQAHPLTKYRWNTGDSTLSVKATRTGWYRVTASNPCATRTDSVWLRVIPRARAVIPDDTVFCEGAPALIDAGFEGADYRWSTGETTRTISLSEKGKYWVEIRNRCSAATDTFNLVFVPEDLSATIPNVFTPDGDGINERFETYTINRNYSLTIVDRWGKVVYRTRNPLAYWNGRINGAEAQSGIYFYAITATDCRGNPVSYKGHVSVLK